MGSDINAVAATVVAAAVSAVEFLDPLPVRGDQFGADRHRIGERDQSVQLLVGEVRAGREHGGGVAARGAPELCQHRRLGCAADAPGQVFGGLVDGEGSQPVRGERGLEGQGGAVGLVTPCDDEECGRAEFGVEHGAGDEFGQRLLCFGAVLEDEQHRRASATAGGADGVGDGAAQLVTLGVPALGRAVLGLESVGTLERLRPDGIGAVVGSDVGQADNSEPDGLGDERLDEVRLARAGQPVQPRDGTTSVEGILDHLLEVGALASEADRRAHGADG